MARTTADPTLMPGTLDLLILKTLSRTSLHGYGIAQQIKMTSQDVLEVEEGSLYPALQRLELKGLVDRRQISTGWSAPYRECCGGHEDRFFWGKPRGRISKRGKPRQARRFAKRRRISSLLGCPRAGNDRYENGGNASGFAADTRLGIFEGEWHEFAARRG
ncbi:hypothetical protein SBA3_2370008 [Candidatus Sulfopaludibacter sp. SbA3]|nr:hypothetical protein SBA3_2370008 [Candidatus Sulfopaludibacter sp. SbA3]